MRSPDKNLSRSSKPMIQAIEQPLISVVIPTYNRADLIYRAISSVLEQSYQNLEIIVVDDNSQDNTESVVQGMNDDRIRYYRLGKNQGGSVSRNKGIQESQGQYIAFLDSDDLWLASKLECQLQAINVNTSNFEQVVSYTKFQKSSRVFYQRSVLPQRGKKKGESIADYFWLGGGEVLTSTLMVSRSLAVANLFQPGLAKHQDLDFVLRLGQNDPEFIFVDQILTIWHNESRSDRISKRINYQLSLDWIEGYREQISERAFKGFVLKEVVPKMLLNEDTKSTAVNLLIGGFREGIIPLNYFLFLIIKQAIPRDYQQSLKMLYQKIK